MCVWLPADYAAAGCVDYLETEKPFLHLCHPKPVPFTALTEPIAKLYGLGKVSYAKWVDLIAEQAAKVGKGELKPSKYLAPGIRLLDTYRCAITPEDPAFKLSYAFGLMFKVTGREGTAASETLSDPSFPALNEKDVLTWVNYWKSIGFLPPQ